MSIIYEALRKIEKQNPQSLNPKPKEEPEEPRQVQAQEPLTQSTSTLQKPKEHRRFSRPQKIIAAIIALLFSAVAVLALLPDGQNASRPPDSGGTVLIQPKAQPQKGVEYILEGIVYDEKVPLAIINGKVHRHYDRLGDYMVVDITEKEVTLRNINDEGLLHLALPF